MGQRLAADLTVLTGAGLDVFHRYAFPTVRQCGATAELAASFLNWLAEHGVTGVTVAAYRFTDVAVKARALELKLSRAAHGRTVAIDEITSAMAGSWSEGMALLAAWAGDPGARSVLAR
jgi:hypothetical protein